MLKTYISKSEDHIKDVCEKSIAIADKNNQQVQIVFNGYHMVAKPGDRPYELVNHYNNNKCPWAFSPSAGTDISVACSSAVEIAREVNRDVEFNFNNQKMVATPTSNPEDLVAFWKKESDRKRAEWVASPEYAEKQEKYRLKQEAEDKALKEALNDAPESMTLNDTPEVWEEFQKNNSDGYGAGIMGYAERWACIMEARMKQGDELVNIADECSRIADNDGITGFMYGCAVSTLAQCWIHGEALRKWHNKDTQLGDEGDKANENGGTLNPALLNL